MVKHILVSSIIIVASSMALAKLPPLDDAAKEKAAEAAAKAAWQGKVDGYQLCKAQDKVASKYGKMAPKPVAAVTGAPAQPAATPGLPACADPGPFVYTAPGQAPVQAAAAPAPAPAMPAKK